MTRAAARRGATLAAAVAALAAAPACATFLASVQTSAASLATYVVPAPGGIRCSGLASLTSSHIDWDAVAPPVGQSVAYVVTAPNGSVTTQAATSYALPVATLPGQYRVRAQISSGWQSPAATITVSLTVLGLLYLCRVP